MIIVWRYSSELGIAESARLSEQLPQWLGASRLFSTSALPFFPYQKEDAWPISSNAPKRNHINAIYSEFSLFFRQGGTRTRDCTVCVWSPLWALITTISHHGRNIDNGLQLALLFWLLRIISPAVLLRPIERHSYHSCGLADANSISDTTWRSSGSPSRRLESDSCPATSSTKAAYIQEIWTAKGFPILGHAETNYCCHAGWTASTSRF